MKKDMTTKPAAKKSAAPKMTGGAGGGMGRLEKAGMTPPKKAK